MISRFLLLAIVGLSILVPARADAGADDSNATLVERQAFELVNRYRQQQHLSSLEWNDAAARLARKHAQDMADGSCDFGHDGFGDRISALRHLITGVTGAGENVFETSDPTGPAESAVGHWLQSPPHLHNIRGDFTVSGIGAVRWTNGNWYFTQIFLKVSQDTLPVPPPALTTPGLPLAP